MRTRHTLLLVSLLTLIADSASGQTRAQNGTPAPTTPPVDTGTPDTASFVIPSVAPEERAFGPSLSAVCKRTVDLEITSGPRLNADELQKRLAKIPLGTSATSEQAQAVLDLLHSLRPTCDALIDPAKWTTLEYADLHALRVLRPAQEFRRLESIVSLLEFSKSGVLEVASAVKAAGPVTLSGPAAPTGMALSGFSDKLFGGMADFLVTRAKQEAVLYLKKHITDEVCKDDALSILPNTCRALTTLDSSLSLSGVGTYLHAAGKQDVLQLPDSLLLLATQKDPKHHPYYEGGRLMFASFVEVRRGRSPLVIAESLHRLPLRKCERSSAQTGVTRTCANIFRAIRWASAGLHAADQRSHAKLATMSASDPQRGALAIAWVLDFEAALQTAYQNTTALTLETVRPLMSTASILVLRDRELVTAVSPLMEHESEGKISADEKRRRIAAVALSVSQELLLATRDLAPLLWPKPSDQPQYQEVLQYIQLAEQVAKIGRDAVDENLGDLALHSSEFLATLRANGLLPESAVTKKVFSAIPFVVEISSAKDSKDVAAAFEASAAPVGSYEAKYQRNSVSINAFLGALYGKEAIQSSQYSGTSTAYAGFAPIGLHLTTPLVRNLFYLGGMFSLLDIGALTTQRLHNEVSSDTAKAGSTAASSQSSNVGFGQFFSPGAYATLGVFDSPITIGFGASVSPSLRNVQVHDSAGNVSTSDDVSVIRWGGFVGLDLTLLPL